jgi:uncharacterized membrane protein
MGGRFVFIVLIGGFGGYDLLGVFWLRVIYINVVVCHVTNSSDMLLMTSVFCIDSACELAADHRWMAAYRVFSG